MGKKKKTKGEEKKDEEKERKKSILCHSMFEHIKKPEGFKLAVKTIKECLIDMERVHDIYSQIKDILNSGDKQKKDDLLKLLRHALDEAACADLMRRICYNCEVRMSYENCRCKIRVYKGLTTKELLEAVVGEYSSFDLSFGEVLEKAFNASVNLHKENGILGGLIHIFEHGIPSLDEAKVHQA